MSRRPPSHCRPLCSPTRQVANTTQANNLPKSTSVRQQVNRQDTSGLTPLEVGLTLAILFGVFLVLLFVGGLCKVFNKPRKEARPYVTGQQKLYQPSAAGYGTRLTGLRPPEANLQGQRSSLLAGASPMGRGGMSSDMRDTSMDTPVSSGSGGQDYFGKIGGHSRGQSTGINLPGATAASSRRGGSAHPPVAGSSVGPDGSGFKPGQVFNYNALGSSPSGYASRPNNLNPPRMVGGPRGTGPPNVGLGPPPASDARRRSRYTRADSRRIDSVGPGVIRKSMFLAPGDEYAQEGGAPRTSSSNMRRVDSVGRGDHRRKSTYNGTVSRQSRSASFYNTADAQEDNFGAGRGGDPLGASYDYLSPSTKPRQMRGPSPQHQPSMSAIQRQVSPPSFSAAGLPPPSAMGGAPVIGKQIGGYPLAAGGYPGGGAPRMRPNQAYAPMAGGYDRGPRQIV